MPGKLILVVDDDPDLRVALGEILTDAGYEVGSAADGRQALEILRAGPKPDLILLDLMMPVMNGWQFLAQRAKEPAIAQIPVVAISAVGAFVQQVEPIEAAAFLRKPVALGDLLETVARFTRGAA